MFFFRFSIPTNKDGSVVTYSQGWCGTRDRCAKNEKGILYNDKELWGIGQAEGDFIPPDVEVIDAKKVAELMLGTQITTKEAITIKDGSIVFGSKVQALPIAPEGVYYGEKLVNREADAIKAEETKQTIEQAEAILKDEPIKEPYTTKYISCPICHKVFVILKVYDDGSVSVFSLSQGKEIIPRIKCANLNITCDAGHKVQVDCG